MCEVKHCRKGHAIMYYGKEVCQDHWNKHCNENSKFNLKEEFEIRS